MDAWSSAPFQNARRPASTQARARSPSSPPAELTRRSYAPFSAELSRRRSRVRVSSLPLRTEDELRAGTGRAIVARTVPGGDVENVRAGAGLGVRHSAADDFVPQRLRLAARPESL